MSLRSTFFLGSICEKNECAFSMIADTSSILSPKEKIHIQKVCKELLYTCRSVDNAQFNPLNELSIKATTATKETQEALVIFLNCYTVQAIQTQQRSSEPAT